MAKQSLVLPLFCMAFVIVSSAQRLPDLARNHCMLACPDGKILDTEACVCVDFGPVDTVCPLIRCPMRELLPCERYKRDERGCITCECQCYKFSLMCPHDCRYGHEYFINSQGCKICQCAGHPTEQQHV